MAGITILNTGEYLVRTTGGFNLFFLIPLFMLIIPTIFFILCCFLGTELGTEKEFFLIEVFSIIIGISFSFATRHFGGEKITVPKYKVTIDDSVTYKDFTNRYEVIKQEGQIYTIIDKEDLAAAEKK